MSAERETVGRGLTVYARRDPALDQEKGELGDRRRWSLTIACIITANNNLKELGVHIAAGRDEFLRHCHTYLSHHFLKQEDYIRIWNILKYQVTTGRKLKPQQILYWKGD